MSGRSEKLMVPWGGRGGRELAMLKGCEHVRAAVRRERCKEKRTENDACLDLWPITRRAGFHTHAVNINTRLDSACENRR